MSEDMDRLESIYVGARLRSPQRHGDEGHRAGLRAVAEHVRAEERAARRAAEGHLASVRRLVTGEKQKAEIITSVAGVSDDLVHQWQAVSHMCDEVLAALDGGGGAGA